jgi:hypothetical protein
METHVKVLGILNIVFGGLGLLGAFVLMIIFGGVAGLVGAEGDTAALPIIGLTGASLVLIAVLTSLPAVIIGFGLYRLQPWSRIAGIVISILALLAFPLGTALGIYGLWVLFYADAQRLFEGVRVTPATPR